MESNIKIKDTPKLNISSAVFGDKDSAGDSTGSIRNIHKTLSKLIQCAMPSQDITRPVQIRF